MTQLPPLTALTALTGAAEKALDVAEPKLTTTLHNAITFTEMIEIEQEHELNTSKDAPLPASNSDEGDEREGGHKIAPVMEGELSLENKRSKDIPTAAPAPVKTLKEATTQAGGNVLLTTSKTPVHDTPVHREGVGKSGASYVDSPEQLSGVKARTAHVAQNAGSPMHFESSSHQGRGSEVPRESAVARATTTSEIPMAVQPDNIMGASTIVGREQLHSPASHLGIADAGMLTSQRAEQPVQAIAVDSPVRASEASEMDQKPSVNRAAAENVAAMNRQVSIVPDSTLAKEVMSGRSAAMAVDKPIPFITGSVPTQPEIVQKTAMRPVWPTAEASPQSAAQVMDGAPETRVGIAPVDATNHIKQAVMAGPSEGVASAFPLPKRADASLAPTVTQNPIGFPKSVEQATASQTDSGSTHPRAAHASVAIPKILPPGATHADTAHETHASPFWGDRPTAVPMILEMADNPSWPGPSAAPSLAVFQQHSIGQSPGPQPNENRAGTVHVAPTPPEDRNFFSPQPVSLSQANQQLQTQSNTGPMPLMAHSLDVQRQPVRTETPGTVTEGNLSRSATPAPPVQFQTSGAAMKPASGLNARSNTTSIQFPVTDQKVERFAFDPLPLTETRLTSETAMARQLSDTLIPRTEIPRHIAMQLAEVAQRGRHDRPMDVTLNPMELGRVRMTVQSAEGVVSVQIVTERPETLDLMRRHVDALAQEFQEMGYGGAEFMFGQQQSDTQQGREATSRSDASAPNDDIPLLSDASQPVTQSSMVITDRVDIRI